MTSKKRGLPARRLSRLFLSRVIDEHRSLESLWSDSSFCSLPLRDQSLVRAILHTALRHRGELADALLRFMDRKPPSRAPHLLHTLHISAAQILFMDIPDHSAIDLAVSDLRSDSRTERFAGFGNAVLRRVSESKSDILSKDIDERVRLNCPDWFWRHLRKDYGKDRALLILRSHLESSDLHIVVKSDIDSWSARLGGEILFGDVLRVPKTDVSTLSGYDSGEWWIQDAAATLPVCLFGDVRGKRVLDLCCAPGGKTIQLAHRGADVVSLDISASRLTRLYENLRRVNLEAQIVESDLFTYRPKELYDFVLLDSPCSSTGTIRRHPDIPWTKGEDDIIGLSTLQKEMIIAALSMVKVGGILVFSNCSLCRVEGEHILSDLLHRPDIEIVPIVPSDIFHFDSFINGQGALRTFPSPSGFGLSLDGFFAARLRRV